MTGREEAVDALRRSEVAAGIRPERLVVILRRVAPQARPAARVRELADAGPRSLEVTFDAPSPAERAPIVAAVRDVERAA